MILLRADGNKTIGSGHVMRCLSIAAAFRTRKQKCSFVVADDSFAGIIEQSGYNVIILGTDYQEMESEISLMRKIIDDLDVDKVIVDSYFVTENYLAAVKSMAELIYIDDLAAFAYPVNSIVNYNVYGTEDDYVKLYENSNIDLPNLFLGMKYAPLRDEFKRVNKKNVAKCCRNILISTGGADSLHLASEMVRFINEKNVKEYIFHFVLGAMNQDIEKIKELAEELNNVRLHINVTNMQELMCSCDIAVSAAGSTLYELCACGVPTITYVLADNQIPGAKAFEKQRTMVYLGDLRYCENKAEKVIAAVNQLACDCFARKQLSTRMIELIDGCGAERLVDKLLCF